MKMTDVNEVGGANYYEATIGEKNYVLENFWREQDHEDMSMDVGYDTYERNWKVFEVDEWNGHTELKGDDKIVVVDAFQIATRGK
ncbi:unnamed protein product [marine sediment metagenome]|uniref:Uncharacterized protein n=1 Tax=marine sediment metagenome TaxID=412755 RepID=X0VB49_9ZZZZ